MTKSKYKKGEEVLLKAKDPQGEFVIAKITDVKLVYGSYQYQFGKGEIDIRLEEKDIISKMVPLV